MDIQILELEKIEQPTDGPGYLRVYVKVLATKGDLSFTEEFHIGRQVTGRRVVTDARGWFKTVAGRYIDPETIQPEDDYTWAYEPFVLDFRAEIMDVVQKTMRGKFDRKAKQDPPDFMKRRIVRFGDSRELPLPVRLLSIEAMR